VWLTDREKFDELQMAALNARVEVLKAEGWSDVQLVVNPDYKFRQDNIAVEGRILKADRGRFNAFVEYSSHSGRVEELRGYTTRRELKASEKAAKTGKAKAEDVKPLTCFDHSRTQQEIMGAHLTAGLAAAIAGGDTWLALKTLVEPLLVDEGPAWAGLKETMPNYIGVNAMEGPVVPLAGRLRQNVMGRRDADRPCGRLARHGRAGRTRCRSHEDPQGVQHRLVYLRRGPADPLPPRPAAGSGQAPQGAEPGPQEGSAGQGDP
jgi:hypothetical protein